MELQVHDLHKSFDGREVLHGISFSISSGKALGLLGRNGAGKSTMIRILMDVFKADQGNMSMNGKTFHAKDYNIGYSGYLKQRKSAEGTAGTDTHVRSGYRHSG